MKIAVVVSLFNDIVTKNLFKHALAGFAENGISENDYEVFYVPGAFEIPAFTNKLIASKRFDGVLALGAIIKGETDHYKYLCRGVVYGMQKVTIENMFPVIFGILTCQNEDLALKRASRGKEYAKQIIELIKTYQK